LFQIVPQVQTAKSNRVIRKQFAHFFFPFDFGFGLRVAVREVDDGQVTRLLVAGLVVAVDVFGLLVRVFRYTYEDRMRPVVDLVADVLVSVAVVRSCFS
tara:strand:+ start:255 stop:551 length:297 start_codon:yes stop_codon:yes gene_type:complete